MAPMYKINRIRLINLSSLDSAYSWMSHPETILPLLNSTLLSGCTPQNRTLRAFTWLFFSGGSFANGPSHNHQASWHDSIFLRSIKELIKRSKGSEASVIDWSLELEDGLKYLRKDTFLLVHFCPSLAFFISLLYLLVRDIFVQGSVDNWVCLAYWAWFQALVGFVLIVIVRYFFLDSRLMLRPGKDCLPRKVDWAP